MMNRNFARAPYPIPMFLTLLTLFLGALGACVGYAWSLPSLLMPVLSRADFIWVMGWTVIGSIQGASLYPAFCLGQGQELRGLSRFLLGLGNLATSLVALSVWHDLGRGKALSFSIACGLSLMCAAPLLAYFLARLRPTPHHHAGI